MKASRVFGRAESVDSEAGCYAGGGYLPQGRDQPGNLLQLQEELRRGLMPHEICRLKNSRREQ
jgi:hypothetical protein